jgi:hypothetical protein
MLRKRVNFRGGGKSRKSRFQHPMWYEFSLLDPYLAENEIELSASQRFGRDSFQTRSTR